MQYGRHCDRNRSIFNMDNNQQNPEPFFKSLSKLKESFRDGTYTEILDDWRWIWT